MANTEQIEAKLCAYVDGELDATGRAEIEQHLATNPQHRQLLEELRAQRQWLRDLPREKAPEDLFDSFQSQIERSVLLDGGRPHTAGRINPWPQVFALAAVLVLAVGLAAVIYFVLPDQSKQRTNYAVMPSATAPAEADRAKLLADATRAPGAGATPVATPSAPAVAIAPVAAPAAVAVAEKPGPADAVAMKSESSARISPSTGTPSAAPTALALSGTQSNDVFAGKSDNSGNRSELKIAADNKDGSMLFDQLPLEPEIQRSITSTAMPDNSMVMVVASANPTMTDKDVTGYLAQNNIRWDDVTEPMPTGVAGLKDAGFLNKQQAPQMSKGEPNVNGTLMKQVAEDADKRKVTENEKVAKKEEAAAEPAPASQPSSSQVTASAPAQAQSVAENAPAQNIVAQNAPPPSATTQPPAAFESISGQVRTPTVAQVPQTGQQVQVDTLTLQQQVQSNGAPRTRMIVARNMTQDQISQLNVYACNNGRVSNYRRNGSEITPTTLPSNGALAFNTGAFNNQSGQFQGVQAGVGAGGGAAPVLENRNDLTRDEAGATQPSRMATRGVETAYKAASGAIQQPTTAAVANSAVATTQPTMTMAKVPASAPAVAQLGTAATQQVATTSPVLNVAGGEVFSLTSPAFDDRCDVVIVVKADGNGQLAAPAQIVLPGMSNSASIPTTAGTNVMQKAPAQPTTQPMQMKARGTPSNPASKF